MNFEKEEYVSRCERLRGSLVALGLKGIIVTRGVYMTYLTGAPPQATDRPVIFVLPVQKDPILLYPALDMGYYEKSTWVKDVRNWGPHDFPSVVPHSKMLAKILPEVSMSAGKIGIDIIPDSPLVSAIRSALPRTEFSPCATILAEMMAVKSPKEIEVMKLNAKYADYAYDAAMKHAKIGANTLEVAMTATADTCRKLFAEVPELKIRAPPIAVDMGFGEEANSCLHATWSASHKITKGELGRINPRCSIFNYTVLTGRPVVAGEPTTEQTKVIKAVWGAEKAAFEAMKPGRIVSEIHKIAKDFLKERGYNWLCRTGYELGLFGHGWGGLMMTEAVNRQLKANMTWRLITGWWGRKDGGIQCSDTILVTDEEPEFLTKYTHEPLVVS